MSSTGLGGARSARPQGRRFGYALILIGILSLQVVTGRSAVAAPVVGSDVLYTTDADFDSGTLVNVNHDAPNNNQLQLNTSSGTFPFIWVALSQRCTIAKINTETGAILGEYRTLSDGSTCPQSSRTTVSLDGSVWVGHRGSPAGVTNVALIETNDCVDRNGNGTIETSSGYGDVKPWPGFNAPVTAATDECIRFHTITGGGDSRHMSVDKNGDVWVGDRNNGSIFRKYSGSTGALLVGPLDFACGGYGGLIDGNGVIWSATSGGSILRYDTTQPIGVGNPMCLPYNNYGMAIDGAGNVWVSTLGEGIVRKFAPSGALLGAFPQGVSHAQGLAVDNNGDVWISSSLFCGGGCSVAHLRNDGSLVGLVPTPTGSGSTGVSVDAAGKVWTANLNSNTAVRIDPKAGPMVGGTNLGEVDLTVSFPAGPGGRPLPFPYNYSDMTGQQLFNSTVPQGTWTVVQDGGAPGTEWGTVTWNTEPQGSVPPGTSIVVEARAAETEAGLGSASYASVSNGAPFVMTGRFIQVRVTMVPDQDGNSPVLSDIRIKSTPRDTDLSVTKTESADPVLWGATITYTLNVHNGGPGDATGVSVTDTITGPGTIVSASGPGGPCAVAATSATCPIGALANGASAVVTVDVKADSPGVIDDTVTVSGTQNDPVAGNNAATESTTVLKHPTTLTYNGASGPIANGSPATLGALLTDSALSMPVAGRPVVLTLGTGGSLQTCTGTTNASGQATCTIASVNQPLGPGTVGGAFAGDDLYLPSADSRDTLIYAFPAGGAGGGAFVVGDQSATGSVYFWGSQWAKQNSLSGGPAPNSFKGFATSPAVPACGAGWSSGPGNSVGPPSGPLPSYMGVIVTSSMSKSGSSLSGNTVRIVVVKPDPGYSSNPGHSGTGTVVAVVC